MAHSIEIRRTYKYRLYRNDQRDVYLHHQINVAGCIWNHAIVLQRRYYRLTGKYIPVDVLKSHIATLRRETQRFAFWRDLGSQAVQDVLERLDNSYQRFFNHQSGRPSFKKVKQYSSFTLKQAGWKLDEDTHVRGGQDHPKCTGHITISGHEYKFVKHRPMSGLIKTVTIKRDSINRLWICFSVIEKDFIPDKVSTSRTGGFDFGLKYFLTDEQGRRWMHPLFFAEELQRIKRLNRSVSRKKPDSHNRRRAKWLLARTHIRVAEKRHDFHFQLAHALCDEYDLLVFEDLNLQGMKALWGRKVNDLGFGQFLKALQHVAMKRGKRVVYIDRFERTTGKCSHCGHCQPMELRQRVFACEKCDLVLDRDHNAAINIFYAGASAYTGLGIVRPASAGSPV